jgi:uncharacterized protein (DUF1697 family)
MGSFIVLLRAIGPVTHKVMSMAQWRDAAAADGFVDPQTYVATGNMIVEADDTAANVALRMDRILADLGLSPRNKAVVRTPRQMQDIVTADPFPQASKERPSQLAVYFFAESRPDFGWVSTHRGPEAIKIVGEHLVVEYPIGISASLAGQIEKRSGLVTARNWNTVRGLLARAAARNS